MAQWPTVGRTHVLGAAAAIAAGGLVFMSANVHQARVTIESPHGTHARLFWTLDTTWKAALRRLGMKVGPHAHLNLSLASSVFRPLVIRRAVPVVVTAYRDRFRIWTTQYRVGGVLTSLGLKLGHLDTVTPPLWGKVWAHEHITVIRRWLVAEVVTSTIAYTTNFEPDPQLFKGNRELMHGGHNGRRRETVEVEMQDGRPIRHTLVADRVLTPVKDALIAYGTLDTINRGSGAVNFSRELTMVATAYWPDPTWSTGYTATGMKAQYGVAAVDPSVIPLGTKLYIPGYGFAIAADTGGAIVGDRIDLCYDDATQAIDWGVKTVPVFVVSTP